MTSEMNNNLEQNNPELVKVGSLIIDLSSMKNGFQKEEKKNRQEIWDYVQYRESLIKWPFMNEKGKGGER
jgi:hypothetical protein